MELLSKPAEPVKISFIFVPRYTNMPRKAKNVGLEFPGGKCVFLQNKSSSPIYVTDVQQVRFNCLMLHAKKICYLCGRGWFLSRLMMWMMLVRWWRSESFLASWEDLLGLGVFRTGCYASCSCFLRLSPPPNSLLASIALLVNVQSPKHLLKRGTSCSIRHLAMQRWRLLGYS